MDKRKINKDMIDRKKLLISQIEKKRGSKVICYLTGDRRLFETRIHPEIQPMLYNHLRSFGEVDKIDLFLYSTGGVTMAAWGIVNLIREFCKTFTVIVPFKAYSTATLICLGADEIIMGKLGQLGPVDPSVHMPFNPPAPGKVPGNVLPISVEEVASFIELTKDSKFLGLKSESALVEVLKQLTLQVHPLALGSVYRAITQIKMMAGKLLKNHMTLEKDQAEIDQIVESLTRNLYSHDYIINRKEAKNEIRLKVTEAENIGTDFERLIYDLFHEYEMKLELSTPFNAEAFLGTKDEASGAFQRAFVESAGRTDCFITEKVLKRIEQLPPEVPIPQILIQERILKEGWWEI